MSRPFCLSPRSWWASMACPILPSPCRPSLAATALSRRVPVPLNDDEQHELTVSAKALKDIIDSVDFSLLNKLARAKSYNEGVRVHTARAFWCKVTLTPMHHPNTP